MKRLLHIVLVGIIGLTISTGVTFQYHYCCSQLQSVGLFIAPESCCDETNDCCHDESQSLRLETDFLIPDFFSEILELQNDLGVELLNCNYQYNIPPNYRRVIRIIDPMPPPNIISQQALFQSYLL